MKTVKAIDDNMARLGVTFRHAREECRLSLDDAAGILHIMPNELFEYEHGAKPVPTDILYRLFVMGYKMIEVRVITRRYQVHRNVLRKLKRTIAEAE